MSSHSGKSAVPQRCPWCGSDPTYVRYHDETWGVPIFSDEQLFEFLVLEGAQAGLSWITILKRQESYRTAFAGYDLARIAAFAPEHIEVLMQNSGIIRNRKKIESAIHNAGKFIEIQNEFGSFSNFHWQFTDGRPIQNHWQTMADVPPYTALSTQISNELRKRGFQFVGPTVMYAFMQATGMVNDHLVSCHRHERIHELSRHPGDHSDTLREL